MGSQQASCCVAGLRPQMTAVRGVLYEPYHKRATK